jgi:hypothetical protein
MKSYRNAVATLLLTFVLTTSVSAADGIMYTGITAPPPPPPAQADGIMYTGIAAPAPEVNALTEIALNLLQTLIPLL